MKLAVSSIGSISDLSNRQERVNFHMEWCCNCQKYVPVRVDKRESDDGKHVYIQRTCRRCNMTLNVTRQEVRPLQPDPGKGYESHESGITQERKDATI